MDPQYWLIKSEPDKYPYSQLVKDGMTSWDGIRNYQARNNLRAMRKGDLVLFYHSNVGKEVVGVARVRREAYPDPGSPEDFSAVDLEPVAPLAKAVTLADMHENAHLSEMDMLRRPRLSVVSLKKSEFDAILVAGETRLKHGRR